MVANRNTIPRLCQYKNALLRFKELGFTKIFSEYLADATGSSGAVVRKDFSFFNITGKKRGGYEIDILLERIKTVLGKNKVQKVILAGAGNLCSALLKYKNFIKENISIEAAFDLDPAKVSRKSKIPVLPLVEMNDYIAANGIETGIITVPESSAQQVFDLMVSAGISGVLNFSPILLRAPKCCVVQNVNLAVALENLIYFSRLAKKNCVQSSIAA